MREGGSTTSLSVTGGDAATVAKALRKSERIPLDKLCAQIRQENYRDWAKWERSLDFADTMAGRYGLSCPDQESFTFAPDGAASAQAAPVASYWELRLAEKAAQERVPATLSEDLPLFAASQERTALARECAQEMSEKLHALLAWAADANTDASHLVRLYTDIAKEIHDAEAWLGLSLNLDALQLEAELALMALA